MKKIKGARMLTEVIHYFVVVADHVVCCARQNLSDRWIVPSAATGKGDEQASTRDNVTHSLRARADIDETSTPFSFSSLG